MAGEISVNDVLLLPMKLDAFVFNEHVSNGGDNEAVIAPITQPNYTFLRLQDFYLQNDVLNHADLHATRPASKNPRYTNLRTGEPRKNRVGVYLHWMVPRLYRMGTVTGDAENKTGEVTGRYAPTRWLVVRQIDRNTIEPAEAADQVPEVDAWVIESDCARDLVKDLTESDDMQVDVSPFIAAQEGNTSIEKQAEIFIGKKVRLDEWKKDGPGVKPPRVPINLLNSSNPVFADYQPHNSNVFSMVDPLEYGSGSHKLLKATVSYCVIGWHVSDAEDPLFSRGGRKREEQIKQLGLKLADSTPAGLTEWLRETSATRTVCHGSMYDVEWDVSRKPKHVPADVAARRLNERLPIAIGESPLDALLAFVDGHRGVDPRMTQSLMTHIDALRLLLRAQDDCVESQRQAEDQLARSHYASQEGGVEFHLTDQALATEESEEETKKKRVEMENKQLKELNQNQALLSSATRTRRQMTWDLFALWWKYLSDSNGKSQAATTTLQVEALSHDIDAIDSQIVKLTKLVKQSVTMTLPAAKPAAQPPFMCALNPTLLVGGIELGWPLDFLDPVRVRVGGQTVPRLSLMPPMAGDWTSLLDNIGTKLPDTVATAAVGLLHEFTRLSPAVEAAIPIVPSALDVIPMFHDQETKPESGTRWRDRWEDTQPWFPLFMEWEAEYTHIPFDHWELKETTSSRSTVEQLTYQLKPETVLGDIKSQLGRQLVSGRTLIQPQPTVSLGLLLSQILQDTPADVRDKYLPEDAQKELLAELNQLAFLSAPLSGFTEHLTTRYQGSHIKPFVRLPDGRGVVLEEALQASKDAGFTLDNLGYMIDGDTDLTPYGTLVPPPSTNQPRRGMFKPATHGQFRLTKVNIFDKFGQVIHAVDPTVSRTDAAPLYPCISEGLRPPPRADNTTIANTPHPDKPGLCEFVQLPPRINQMARINAHFVEIVEGPAYRVLAEDESPVWGWIVVNFPNKGLQIFLPDGTFYREICIGGPKGTLTSDAWLPFGPPKHENTPVKQPAEEQLENLIKKLQDPHYLKGFSRMINEASRNNPAAPKAYAGTTNSITGRPLALVNMGWSLELAGDAYTNQSSFFPNKLPGERTLSSYKFPIKVGDRNRLFDGMLGYFTPRVEDKTPGEYFDLTRLHTFYVEDHNGDKDPRKETNIAQPPISLSPTWVPPVKRSSPDEKPKPVTSSDYAQTYSKNLEVVAAVIDPFTAITVHSGILPPKSLQMLEWVWQNAFQKMTAFFRVGPVIMTKEVPSYKKESRQTDRWDEVEPVRSDVRLHTMQGEKWAWLQPYLEAGETVHMPLTVDQVEPGLSFEPGPYTAIEGYLHLRKALASKQSS